MKFNINTLIDLFSIIQFNFNCPILKKYGTVENDYQIEEKD